MAHPSNAIYCSRFFTHPEKMQYTSAIVSSRITRLTPEEFDSHIANFAEYLPSDGGSDGMIGLHWAALYGNEKLVTHILESGGMDLIDMGDAVGRTALFHACREDEEENLATAQKLIEFGAEVNVATTSTNDGREYPRGSTPLWAALQKAQSVALATLLLKHGGNLGGNPKLSQKAQVVFEQAKKALEDQLQSDFKQQD